VADQPDKVMRQGKNNVIIGSRNGLFQPVVDPFVPGYALTLGAMTVPAGVKGLICKAAMVALINVITHQIGTAVGNRPHDFALFIGQFMFGFVGLAVLLEYIGDFKCGLAHPLALIATTCYHS